MPACGRQSVQQVTELSQNQVSSSSPLDRLRQVQTATTAETDVQQGSFSGIHYEKICITQQKLRYADFKPPMQRVTSKCQSVQLLNSSFTRVFVQNLKLFFCFCKPLMQRVNKSLNRDLELESSSCVLLYIKIPRCLRNLLKLINI